MNSLDQSNDNILEYIALFHVMKYTYPEIYIPDNVDQLSVQEIRQAYNTEIDKILKKNPMKFHYPNAST